ncbi:MAG: recombination-associated protein RdgC [Gammaproteobacteria bacterium]|jgi:recombination associated protein RdgC|nr:recombination-associated protein RdgC [Gammaproteobacteria bacterium]
MFRNVRFYRLDGVWPESEEALSTSLEQAGFEPCGPLTERSSGWVAVDPDTSDLLARRLNGADLVRLRSQSRVLPAAVINEELEARIEEYRNRMQEAPSPREKRRLKAEARDELMPKAMPKSDRIWGYIDLKEKVLGIDTALESVAERFLRRMQASLDGINIRPLQFMKPVDELLSGIFFEDAPRQFSLGRECRMQDLGDAASKVRWTDFDLSDKSIRDHVANGMRLTHLSIVYDNIMNFVLDENGVISKLRFVGMDDDNEDHNDPLARQDAEFVLITGTLRNLLGDLKKQLGGYA